MAANLNYRGSMAVFITHNYIHKENSFQIWFIQYNPFLVDSTIYIIIMNRILMETTFIGLFFSIVVFRLTKHFNKMLCKAGHFNWILLIYFKLQTLTITITENIYNYFLNIFIDTNSWTKPVFDSTEIKSFYNF